MNHSCKQLQSELNYWFTLDQPGELPEELRRQVTICPDCREHLQELKETKNLLVSTQADPDARLEKSLWPQIQKRLKSQPVNKSVSESRSNSGRLLSPEQTNLWSQRIALISISLALLTVVSGPLFQLNQHQAQRDSNFHPQYEFTRFEDNSAASRFPIYPSQLPSSLYRDVTLPADGKPQFLYGKDLKHSRQDSLNFYYSPVNE